MTTKEELQNKFKKILEETSKDRLSYSVSNYALKSMKAAAALMLDMAAENAKTIQAGNTGSWYDASVDVDSILKLKELL